MEILEYILNPSSLPDNIFTIYTIVKIIFILASVSLITLIIFLLIKSDWLYTHYIEDITEVLNMESYDMSQISKQWKKIKKRIDKATESERKLAVLEADKLLDSTLARLSYEGKTSGERIKQCSDLDEEIWEAHQIRNDIVHDPSVKISEDMARKALAIYERALEKLRAI